MDQIEKMLGRTAVAIVGQAGGEEIVFTFSGGATATFYHEQDCCESVEVHDINGDWADIIGSPILVAEERTEDDPDTDESGTWTFYTFRTVKGSVDVRWYGESNGYYSESVDMEFREPNAA